jgi:hypothetical protein
VVAGDLVVVAKAVRALACQSRGYASGPLAEAFLNGGRGALSVKFSAEFQPLQNRRL